MRDNFYTRNINGRAVARLVNQIAEEPRSSFRRVEAVGADGRSGVALSIQLPSGHSLILESGTEIVGGRFRHQGPKACLVTGHRAVARVFEGQHAGDLWGAASKKIDSFRASSERELQSLMAAITENPMIPVWWVVRSGPSSVVLAAEVNGSSFELRENRARFFGAKRTVSEFCGAFEDELVSVTHIESGPVASSMLRQVQGSQRVIA